MSQRPKKFSDAIDKLEDYVPGARERLEGEVERLEQLLADLTPPIEGVKQTRAKLEAKVQRNPWATFGIVALIGIIFGFWWARKKERS